MTTFTIEQVKTLDALAIGVTIPSMLASLFVIACYTKFKDLRNHAFTLVLFMAVCDVFSGIARMMGDSTGNPNTCRFQSVLMSFFESASVLWSFLIAFTLHMAFLNEKDSFSSQKIGQQMWKYHLFGWGFPLIMTFLPFSTDSVGGEPGAAWCWIKSAQWYDIFWRYTQFYGPLWLVVGYCCFVYTKVLLKIKALGGTANDSSASKKLMRRIMYYPAVLIFCWWAASVNRLVELSCDCKHYGLTVCQILFSGLFGLMNALVYGLTPVVKAHIRLIFVGGTYEASENAADTTAEAGTKL